MINKFNLVVGNFVDSVLNSTCILGYGDIQGDIENEVPYTRYDKQHQNHIGSTIDYIMWNKESYLVKYVQIMGHEADVKKSDHVLMLAYLYDAPANEV